MPGRQHGCTLFCVAALESWASGESAVGSEFCFGGGSQSPALMLLSRQVSAASCSSEQNMLNWHCE